VKIPGGDRVSQLLKKEGEVGEKKNLVSILRKKKKRKKKKKKKKKVRGEVILVEKKALMKKKRVRGFVIKTQR